MRKYHSLFNIWLGKKWWALQMTRALVHFLLCFRKIVLFICFKSERYLSEMLPTYNPSHSQLDWSFPHRVTKVMFKDIVPSDIEWFMKTSELFAPKHICSPSSRSCSEFYKEFSTSSVGSCMQHQESLHCGISCYLKGTDAIFAPNWVAKHLSDVLFSFF